MALRAPFSHLPPPMSYAIYQMLLLVLPLSATFAKFTLLSSSVSLNYNLIFLESFI